MDNKEKEAVWPGPEGLISALPKDSSNARLANARQDAADGRTYDALGMGNELRKEYGI